MHIMLPSRASVNSKQKGLHPSCGACIAHFSSGAASQPALSVAAPEWALESALCG